MGKELAEAVKLFISQPLNNPMTRGQIMEVARIALPILEQQERGDGWIEWAGGECPLEDSTIVDIKHRDGRVAEGEMAGNYIWTHGYYHYLTKTGADIIAYRIIPEQPTNQNGEQWYG